jgi:cysteine-S-conjugate beta-lyase
MYDFDRIIDRRHTDSYKWRAYGEEVLPLWVADMDFLSPEPVLRALYERIGHGVMGYAMEPPELREVLVSWLKRRFHWQVSAEALISIPGVVTGFNVACRAVSRPGDGVLVQTPVYPPMLAAPANHGLVLQQMALTQRPDGGYEVDTSMMDATITDKTQLFMLCNPQNPTGRAFTCHELSQMAEVCLRRGVRICSDEIHCDLVFSGARHVPIASLAPEITAQTITLMAPSKTFNIPGLGYSLAIIENPELRKAFKAAMKDIVPHVNALGYAAALAAYSEGEPWLEACLRYLEANRDYLAGKIAADLPGVTMTVPEATYLAWLDCRAAQLPQTPQAFFLKQARVALNDGASFGAGGEGFARLNFACPRQTLGQALSLMSEALANR